MDLLLQKNNFLYYGRSDEAKRTMTSENTEHLNLLALEFYI